MTALRDPFPPEHIEYLPKAGKEFAFVSHGHVTERLLDAVGEFDFEIVGDPVTVGLESDANVGVFARMTIGGSSRMEFGNGKTLKDAVSDAVKRCAMRFGVALELWIGDDKNGSAPTPEKKAAPHLAPFQKKLWATFKAAEEKGRCNRAMFDKHLADLGAKGLGQLTEVQCNAFVTWINSHEQVPIA